LELWELQEKSNIKENAVKVVFSCVAFNILLLITIAIIYRRRKNHFFSNVYSMEMINLNLENEGIIFHTSSYNIGNYCTTC
jgi:hypothetical protein